MSKAIDKPHQLTMTAPAIPTEYVRKLIKAEKVKSANIGLYRDSAAMLVLGPHSPKTIPGLNKDGHEIHVSGLKLTEIDRDIIMKAKSMYAS